MTTPALLVSDAVDRTSPECGVCAHSDATHDAIARRYCRATMAGALSRTCICSVVAT